MLDIFDNNSNKLSKHSGIADSNSFYLNAITIICKNMELFCHPLKINY